MSTVYEINKGINRSIEFKGIKAQYIIYLACGLVVLLLLFAILFVTGVNIYVCMGIVFPGGGGFMLAVQRMSKKYGEHGLQKKVAAGYLPAAVYSRSSKIFMQLKPPSHEKK